MLHKSQRGEPAAIGHGRSSFRSIASDGDEGRRAGRRRRSFRTVGGRRSRGGGPGGGVGRRFRIGQGRGGRGRQRAADAGELAQRRAAVAGEILERMVVARIGDRHRRAQDIGRAGAVGGHHRAGMGGDKALQQHGKDDRRGHRPRQQPVLQELPHAVHPSSLAVSRASVTRGNRRRADDTSQGALL